MPVEITPRPEKTAIVDAKEFSMQGPKSDYLSPPCKVPPCRGCKVPCKGVSSELIASSNTIQSNRK